MSTVRSALPTLSRPLEFVRPEDLGFTGEEIRRRWPDAIEYGPLEDPYWVRENLSDSMEVQGR